MDATPRHPRACPEGAPPSARQLAKDRTIALCLAAARQLFSETTYEEVTMRGLARAMEMSTGAIFANFRDKADVWRCAMLCEPPIDSPLTRAAPALLAVAVALDTSWSDAFPDGPDGTRSWLGGLGHLTEETVDLWRACRAAIAAATPAPLVEGPGLAPASRGETTTPSAQSKDAA